MLVVNNLMQRFLLNGRPRVLFHNLSLTLDQGERLAVLGRNGQGKSTLIKILGNVLEPTRGSVNWGSMNASWPIGFGGAFHGSLTGMDNILFISRVYERPIEYVIHKTEAFAELGPALTQPVKYYSTGMRARLAFGLSLAIDFDCYLIDEVISVGDVRFQKKCFDELFSVKKDRTFVIATHDLTFVRDYCNRALVIESGEATVYDNVADALESYTAITATHEPA